MKNLIIYAHPYQESFNKQIFDFVIKNVPECDSIDLYKDHFNPLLSARDLELYNKGETSDAKVIPYQERISSANRIIFIFPIWWYEAPAILKGFFEKVLLKGFAFTDENGFHGILKKEIIMLTTSSDQTKEIEKPFLALYRDSIFKSLGVDNFKWLNCVTVEKGSQERESFLTSLHKIL